MFYVSIKNGSGDWETLYEPMSPDLTIHSPKVVLEVGKAGTFTFNIPYTNKYYDKLYQLRSMILVEWGDQRKRTEIFRGRVFQISMSFARMRTVTCEGILAYLVDSMIKGTSYKGKARKLFRKIIEKHNELMKDYPDKKFEVGTVNIEDADVVLPGKKEDEDGYYTDKYSQAIIESVDDEWMTSYDAINNILVDYLGGYLIARHDSSTGKNYIDYLNDSGMKDATEDTVQAAHDLSGKYRNYGIANPGINTGDLDDIMDNEGFKNLKIEYGVNLLDLKEEMDVEDLCTVVIPLGDSEDDKTLTIENATNKTEDPDVKVVKIGGKEVGIAHKKAVEKYGWVVKTHSFSNVNQANTLFTNGRKWLKDNRNIPARYTISAVDLKFLNGESADDVIRLGEMVPIVSAPHGLNMKLMCTKIEYDLENAANNKYTLGNPEQTLTERYKKNKDKSSKGGRSGSRKGATAGAKQAAEDAAEVAEDLEEAKEDLERQIADAKFVIDEKLGKISLQAWYNNDKKSLSQVGIDLNAQQGRIDIYAMWDDIYDNNHGLAKLWAQSNADHDEVGALAERVSGTEKSTASLLLQANALSAMIDMLAAHESELGSSVAGLKAYADALRSELELLANWVDKNNPLLGSWTDIKLQADANSARIDILAKHVSQTAASLAELEMIANDTIALINLVASFETDAATSIAALYAQADANGAFIELLASWKDKVNESLESLADIKLQADANGAAIDILAKHLSDLATSTAQISLLANKLLAMIKLIADFEADAATTSASITAKADANESKITMLTTWKDKADAALQSMAKIEILAKSNEAAILQQAEVNTKFSTALAQLTIRATDVESVIEQLAAFVSNSVNNQAKITTKANASEASIELLTQKTDALTGKIKGLASTKQWVDSHSANIEQATKWYSDYGTSALTALSQLSTDDIAKIQLAAEFYTENSAALANIAAWSDEDSAGIKSAAKYVNNKDPNTGIRSLAASQAHADKSFAMWNAWATYNENKASFSLTASANGSVITGIADNFNVFANKVLMKSEEFKIIANKASILGLIEMGTWKDSKGDSKGAVIITTNTGINGHLQVGKSGITTTGSIEVSGDIYKLNSTGDDRDGKYATQKWVEDQKYITKSVIDADYIKNTLFGKDASKKSIRELIAKQVDGYTSFNILQAKDVKSGHGKDAMSSVINLTDIAVYAKTSDVNNKLNGYVSKTNYDSHKHVVAGITSSGPTY